MNEQALRQACASTEPFVAAVTSDQYERPTPCREWDVRSLLNHLLSTLAIGEALLGDRPPSVNASPGGLPSADLLGGDPLGAYRTGVDRLLEAAGGGAVTRPHTTPLGDMPGRTLAGLTALDIVVHGWDLAKATGQDADLDDGLAEQMLAFARETISESAGLRAPLIGPEIATEPGAGATDRLVAFLGRHP